MVGRWRLETADAVLPDNRGMRGGSSKLDYSNCKPRGMQHGNIYKFAIRVYCKQLSGQEAKSLSVVPFPAQRRSEQVTTDNLTVNNSQCSHSY
jgi:hypothetical protein